MLTLAACAGRPGPAAAAQNSTVSGSGWVSPAGSITWQPTAEPSSRTTDPLSTSEPLSTRIGPPTVLDPPDPPVLPSGQVEGVPAYPSGYLDFWTALHDTAALHPDVFGGVGSGDYPVAAGANGPSGFTVYVVEGQQITDDVAAVIAAAPGQGIGITVRSVRYSWAQLQAVMDAVPTAAPFAGADHGGLSSWGIVAEWNSVRVGVLRADDDLRAKVESVFGDMVTVVEEPPSTVAPGESAAVVMTS